MNKTIAIHKRPNISGGDDTEAVDLHAYRRGYLDAIHNIAASLRRIQERYMLPDSLVNDATEDACRWEAVMYTQEVE